MSRKRVLTLDKDNESIDSIKYKGMIGSLVYLTANRPDIMFSVCFCARFQEDPKGLSTSDMDEASMVDYNITLDEVPILCDDKCAINLASSLIDYPRTKHIEIRHHFLKDNVAKKHITIDKIPLGETVANIITKPLENDQFGYHRLGLGLMLQEEEEEEEKK
ncbi:hypothetical protein Tco_1368263 [Tanacetum coccineum]